MEILVVEDDEMNAKVMRYTLQKYGYTATLATTGEQAMDAAGNQEYDLILLDLLLPDLDGIQVAQRILHGHLSRFLPMIVAVTAHLFPGYREECLNAGMTDVIEKPYTITRIREVLHTGQTQVCFRKNQVI